MEPFRGLDMANISTIIFRPNHILEPRERGEEKLLVCLCSQNGKVETINIRVYRELQYTDTREFFYDGVPERSNICSSLIRKLLSFNYLLKHSSNWQAYT